MADELVVGAERSGTVVVAPEHFASRIVAGTPEVFATASLGALVEKTATEWLNGSIEDGQMSVGTQITINHLAPTPEGRTVTVTVRLESAEPPKYEFTWTAGDGDEEVGNGTHQRFVIDRERFMRRVDRKRG